MLFVYLHQRPKGIRGPIGGHLVMRLLCVACPTSNVMSGVKRCAKFPDEFTSKGVIMAGRIDRERAAKTLENGIWVCSIDPVSKYRFVGDEGMDRPTKACQPCHRQEDVADSNERTTHLVPHRWDLETDTNAFSGESRSNVQGKYNSRLTITAI